MSVVSAVSNLAVKPAPVSKVSVKADTAKKAAKKQLPPAKKAESSSEDSSDDSDSEEEKKKPAQVRSSSMPFPKHAQQHWRIQGVTSTTGCGDHSWIWDLATEHGPVLLCSVNLKIQTKGNLLSSVRQNHIFLIKASSVCRSYVTKSGLC